MADVRADYERQLELHLSTWGSHCGASLAVYAGHLNKLLEAHAAMVLDEGYRAGLEAAAKRLDSILGDSDSEHPAWRYALRVGATAIRALPVPKEQS